jgi:hypothetical protein
MTEYKLEYTASAKLAVQIVRSYLWDTRGGYIIASIIVAILSVIFLMYGSYPAFWGVWLGIVLSHWLYWHLSIKDAKKANEVPITVYVRIDDKGISYETEDTKYWTAWSTTIILYHHKRAIRLEKSGSMLPVIPKEYADKDVISFIEQMVTKAGGGIR